MSSHDQHAYPSEASGASTNMIELRERLVTIETKLDNYNRASDAAYRALSLAERNAQEITDIKTTAVETRQNAYAGKTIAENCREDIIEIKESLKWAHRISITIAGGAIINLILNIMQT